MAVRYFLPLVENKMPASREVPGGSGIPTISLTLLLESDGDSMKKSLAFALILCAVCTFSLGCSGGSTGPAPGRSNPGAPSTTTTEAAPAAPAADAKPAE